MGASAGGVEAVSAVIGGLSPKLRAPVLVVIHTGSSEDGLATVLGRRSPLPVQPARDQRPLADGHVYVARPDRHLAVQDGKMRVISGPAQHGFRPAVDVLFLSAARSAGARAAGVILSGALSDGVAGLGAIKRAGGRAIVQSPDQAAVPSMPLNALREVEVDAVLPAADIAADLVRWAEQPLPHNRHGQTAKQAKQLGERERLPSGDLIPISCPSCGGSLSETNELGTRQYKCHVGHRFNPDTLVSAHDGEVESVLWTAVRALQEKALLRRRMHAGATSRTVERLAERWLEEAIESERQAEYVRDLIESVAPPAAAAIAGQLAKQAERAPRRRVRNPKKRAKEA
jgi:two-component system chemotaxis response regulator CheB